MKKYGMNKKEKILKMFDSVEWMEGVKILTYDDFKGNGLSPTIEYGERYCDVIYAESIFRKMGFRVYHGTYAVYVNNENSRYPPIKKPI